MRGSHSSNQSEQRDHRRGLTPAGGRGVQFEHENQEEEQETRKKVVKSESTDPLLTDSLSDNDFDLLQVSGANGETLSAHIR